MLCDVIIVVQVMYCSFAHVKKMVFSTVNFSSFDTESGKSEIYHFQTIRAIVMKHQNSYIIITEKIIQNSCFKGKNYGFCLSHIRT